MQDKLPQTRLWFSYDTPQYVMSCVQNLERCLITRLWILVQYYVAIMAAYAKQLCSADLHGSMTCHACPIVAPQLLCQPGRTWYEQHISASYIPVKISDISRINTQRYTSTSHKYITIHFQMPFKYIHHARTVVHYPKFTMLWATLSQIVSSSQTRLD